jgi:hypothetical protein
MDFFRVRSICGTWNMAPTPAFYSTPTAQSAISRSGITRGMQAGQACPSGLMTSTQTPAIDGTAALLFNLAQRLGDDEQPEHKVWQAA